MEDPVIKKSAALFTGQSEKKKMPIHQQLTGKALPSSQNHQGQIPSCSADGEGTWVGCLSIYQRRKEKDNSEKQMKTPVYI